MAAYRTRVRQVAAPTQGRSRSETSLRIRHMSGYSDRCSLNTTPALKTKKVFEMMTNKRLRLKKNNLPSVFKHGRDIIQHVLTTKNLDFT